MINPSHNDLRDAVACEIRNIVRTHSVSPTMGSWAECGPMIKGRWMKVADRILSLLPTQGVPPGSGALVEEPPFAWPDPKYTAYSFEGPRGITCAVSEDGDIFIRPNATKEELHAALLGVLSDEGVPLPEAPEPPEEGSAREALDELESACKSATEYGSDILLIDYVRPLLGKVRAAFPQATPEEGSAPVPTAEVGAPRWTREKPTAEGWYWCRIPFIGDADVFQFKRDENGVLFEPGEYEDEISRLDDFHESCEWAGPIPEPAGPVAPSGEGRP